MKEFKANDNDKFKTVVNFLCEKNIDTDNSFGKNTKYPQYSQQTNNIISVIDFLSKFDNDNSMLYDNGLIVKSKKIKGCYIIYVYTHSYMMLKLIAKELNDYYNNIEGIHYKAIVDERKDYDGIIRLEPS